MSTTLTKRSWQQAREDAIELRQMLPPQCFVEWLVAGSVRRKKAEVSDVEHVLIPAFGEVDDGGSLFGERKTVNLTWFHLDALLKKGDVAKAIYGDTGFRWGEKYRGVTFRGFTHELYTADADNFGSIYAIRTGPPEFSKRLVTGLLSRDYRNKDGYVWSCEPCPKGDAEGFCYIEPSFKKVEGSVWQDTPTKCPTCDGTGLVPVEKIPAPDEETYFKLCGVPFLAAELRV